ncbi:hypothetical protein NBO_64g0004 [Nosema bombycis CQ1]|uniref:Uncharacterized protein n=1 Tax=Nosema bombycis (strain CQ1 / CVCC 102059) TaxID=578461 RepID=R0KTQ8_NOSB1|nr:hypothetical protein NBO_64g0004 [Nosema bombycis CQ1]|eukprot:EOB13622.1 hypothetical protein NBO_64g0004 [Nosema bombycis CQ1]
MACYIHIINKLSLKTTSKSLICDSNHHETVFNDKRFTSQKVIFQACSFVLYNKVFYVPCCLNWASSIFKCKQYLPKKCFLNLKLFHFSNKGNHCKYINCRFIRHS